MMFHRLPVVDVVERLRKDVSEAEGGEGCPQRLGQCHSEPWQAKVHSLVLRVTGRGNDEGERSEGRQPCLLMGRGYIWSNDN